MTRYRIVANLMKVLSLFVVFFLCIGSLFSRASEPIFQWSAKAREVGRSFSTPSESFRDPYFFTAYGAVRARLGYARMLYPKYRNYIKIPSSYFKSGYQEVLLYREEAHPVGELVIALPGLSTPARSSEMIRSLDVFSNRGYHTAVIANSWSKSYIQERPNHLPGDVTLEAEALLDLIKGIVREIGPSKVSRIHLYGESYGAFLAAAVAATDANSSDPIIFGSVTLAGLPVNLEQTGKTLDALVAKAEEKDVNVSQWQFVRLFWDFLMSPTLEKTDTTMKDVLPQLISVGVFRGHLENALLDISNIEDRPAVARLLGDSKAIRWEKYMKGLASVLEGDKRPRGDHHNAFFWLKQLEKKRPHSYRIVSSRDEFLNEKSQWGDLKEDPKRMIFLPYGGHLGYQGLPWWEDLLDASFGGRIAGAEPAITVGPSKNSLPGSSTR